MRTIANTLLGLLFTSLLFQAVVACNYRPIKGQEPIGEIPVETPTSAETISAPTPAAARLLSICMGQEPTSLFLYTDGSQAARAIRQAIYDGPLDLRKYDLVPIILEKVPRLADGDLVFEPVAVQPGEAIVDSAGLLSSLNEGVSYFPAGCADLSCAAVYSGGEPVQTDQQVVRFRLRAGLKWSDGAPLTADDSQYSFEIAKDLYPRARADLIARTQSYQALDDQTVEWRGLPGYRFSGYAASFFSPLPRHAWGGIASQELLSAEQSNRNPIGWGAYIVDEWTTGDHLTLVRNPNYFRAEEGLPRFEQLVFRFMPSPEAALAALLAGECDYLDETNPLASQAGALAETQSAGKLKTLQWPSGAWEHLVFGISPRAPALPPFFQDKATRQAVAACLDRQQIAAEFTAGLSPLMDSYLSPDHPLSNPQVKKYSFDPGAAQALLDAAGWRDDDANPATPRRSQGLAGIPDGTPFTFDFLTSETPENQRLGEMLRAMLAQCGVELTVKAMPAEQLFQTGEQGPIFGRNFSLAQFGWMSAWQPPCYLFLSQEIPGAFPDFPKGWGGANASGYHSPDFDRACQRALAALPEQPEYLAAHQLAQAIFAEELPALPLYLHLKQAALRPDFCGVEPDSSADSALWNIENFDYGEGCVP